MAELACSRRQLTEKASPKEADEGVWQSSEGKGGVGVGVVVGVLVGETGVGVSVITGVGVSVGGVSWASIDPGESNNITNNKIFSTYPV